VLIQARAAGALSGSLAQLREVAASSARTVTYEPPATGVRPTHSPFHRRQRPRRREVIQADGSRL